MMEYKPDLLADAIYNYMEIADEVADFEKQLKDQRTNIENLLHEAELGSYTVKGVATARIAPGYDRNSYDTDALDKLVMSLIEANTEITDHLARKIRECKKVTTVKASLRIEKDKR
jgi:purine nucleoside permease